MLKPDARNVSYVQYYMLHKNGMVQVYVFSVICVTLDQTDNI